MLDHLGLLCLDGLTSYCYTIILSVLIIFFEVSLVDTDTGTITFFWPFSAKGHFQISCFVILNLPYKIIGFTVFS